MAFSKLTVTLFKAGFGSSSSTLFSTYNGARKKKKSKHLLLFFSQSMKQKQNNQKLLHTNSFVFFDHQTLSFRQCFTGKTKPLQHNTQTIYITEDLPHDSPSSFFPDMSANTSGTYFAQSSFLDGQQLREGMTDELEGTIDISRFGPAQVNQLFGCGKHKMAATVDVHVFFQEGLR